MDDINATNYAQEARTETSGGLHQNYMGATPSAVGLLNKTDNFSKGLGGGSDSAMQMAIRNKYAGEYHRKQERLNLDMLKNANTDHLRKLQTASDLAGQEHQLNMQKEIMRKKQAQAKQAMRAQLVGTVLGIVGGVAGGAMTGGAGTGAGIMAGQALGTGVGTAIGGGIE